MGAIQRVAGTLPLAFDPDYSPARGFLGPRWVTFGRSRVRESRTLGSVGAKAEWLSYPTATASIIASLFTTPAGTMWAVSEANVTTETDPGRMWACMEARGYEGARPG